MFHAFKVPTLFPHVIEGSGLVVSKPGKWKIKLLKNTTAPYGEGGPHTQKNENKAHTPEKVNADISLPFIFVRNGNCKP